jgi:hypothetical protein
MHAGPNSTCFGSDHNHTAHRRTDVCSRDFGWWGRKLRIKKSRYGPPGHDQTLPQTCLRPQTLVPHAAAGSAVLTAWAGHCWPLRATTAPHLLRSLTSCPPASWLHGCWPHNVVLHAHAGRSQRRHRRSNAASPLLPSRERLHHHGYLGSAAASYRRLRPCGKRSRQCRRRARRAVPAHEGKHNLSNADGYRLRDQVGEWGCGDGR